MSMNALLLITLLILQGTLLGCSHDMIQRNSYEMFQIMQREMCLQERTMDIEECYQKESYDEYQRWRKENLEVE